MKPFRDKLNRKWFLKRDLLPPRRDSPRKLQKHIVLFQPFAEAKRFKTNMDLRQQKTSIPPPDIISVEISYWLFAITTEYFQLQLIVQEKWRLVFCSKSGKPLKYPLSTCITLWGIIRKIQRLLSLREQKNGVFPSTQWQQNRQVNIKGFLKMEVKAMWACSSENTNLSHFSRTTSIQHTNSEQGKHMKLLSKVQKDCILTLLIWISQSI